MDGSGGWDTTPYLALESGNTISVPLPRAWTAAGGCAVIRLCVSEFTEGREERSIYTLTGRLQYAGRESGGAMAEEYEDKLPALIMAVTESDVYKRQVGDSAKYGYDLYYYSKGTVFNDGESDKVRCV